MLPTDLESLTPLQRLIIEQAVVLAKELEATAESAPAAKSSIVANPCYSARAGTY